MGTRYNHLIESVLTSTQNLCFEQKYEKISNFFYLKFPFFGKIFSIFEEACFRNMESKCLDETLGMLGMTLNLSFCARSKTPFRLERPMLLFMSHRATVFTLNISTLNITKTCLLKYTENVTTKKWEFSDKNSDIFYISAQNLACEYTLEKAQWDGSNEYPQSVISRNKKIMYTSENPSFTLQKWCLKGAKLYRHVFVMTRHHTYPKISTSPS